MQDNIHTQSEIWHALVDSEKIYRASLKRFLLGDEDRVAILHSALRSEERWIALDIAAYLKEPELQQLFPDLVFLASWGHGSIDKVRHLIVSLPRDWVLAQIEAQAEPYLEDPEEEPYSVYLRFMELYFLLDPALLERLVCRAQNHRNITVREAAEVFTNFDEHQMSQLLLGYEPRRHTSEESAQSNITLER